MDRVEFERWLSGVQRAESVSVSTDEWAEVSVSAGELLDWLQGGHPGLVDQSSPSGRLVVAQGRLVDALGRLVERGTGADRWAGEQPVGLTLRSGRVTGADGLTVADLRIVLEAGRLAQVAARQPAVRQSRPGHAVRMMVAQLVRNTGHSVWADQPDALGVSVLLTREPASKLTLGDVRRVLNQFVAGEGDKAMGLGGPTMGEQAELIAEVEQAKADADSLRHDVGAARDRIAELEAQLAQRPDWAGVLAAPGLAAMVEQLRGSIGTMDRANVGDSAEVRVQVQPGRDRMDPMSLGQLRALVAHPNGALAKPGPTAEVVAEWAELQARYDAQEVCIASALLRLDAMTGDRLDGDSVRAELRKVLTGDELDPLEQLMEPTLTAWGNCPECDQPMNVRLGRCATPGCRRRSVFPKSGDVLGTGRKTVNAWSPEQMVDALTVLASAADGPLRIVNAYGFVVADLSPGTGQLSGRPTPEPVAGVLHDRVRTLEDALALANADRANMTAGLEAERAEWVEQREGFGVRLDAIRQFVHGLRAETIDARMLLAQPVLERIEAMCVGEQPAVEAPRMPTVAGTYDPVHTPLALFRQVGVALRPYNEGTYATVPDAWCHVTIEPGTGPDEGARLSFRELRQLVADQAPVWLTGSSHLDLAAAADKFPVTDEGCTCTQLKAATHLEPADWEQDPDCPVHPMSPTAVNPDGEWDDVGQDADEPVPAEVVPDTAPVDRIAIAELVAALRPFMDIEGPNAGAVGYCDDRDRFGEHLAYFAAVAAGVPTYGEPPMRVRRDAPRYLLPSDFLLTRYLDAEQAAERKPMLGGTIEGTGYWVVDDIEPVDDPLGTAALVRRPALRDDKGQCWASWINLPHLAGLREQLDAGAKWLAKEREGKRPWDVLFADQPVTVLELEEGDTIDQLAADPGGIQAWLTERGVNPSGAIVLVASGVGMLGHQGMAEPWNEYLTPEQAVHMLAEDADGAPYPTCSKPGCELQVHTGPGRGLLHIQAGPSGGIVAVDGGHPAQIDDPAVMAALKADNPTWEGADDAVPVGPWVVGSFDGNGTWVRMAGPFESEGQALATRRTMAPQFEDVRLLVLTLADSLKARVVKVGPDGSDVPPMEPDGPATNEGPAVEAWYTPGGDDDPLVIEARAMSGTELAIAVHQGSPWAQAEGARREAEAPVFIRRESGWAEHLTNGEVLEALVADMATVMPVQFSSMSLAELRNRLAFAPFEPTMADLARTVVATWHTGDEGTMDDGDMNHAVTRLEAALRATAEKAGDDPEPPLKWATVTGTMCGNEEWLPGGTHAPATTVTGRVLDKGLHGVAKGLDVLAWIAERLSR